MKTRTVTTGLATMLAVLALASVSLLAGCSSDKNASLMPGPTPPIADVPIPYGFTIDLSQSQSTYVPNTNLRVVNQLYKGSDPRLSVARFYMTNMPNSGWRMQQEIQNPQAITETFIKGPGIRLAFLSLLQPASRLTLASVKTASRVVRPVVTVRVFMANSSSKSVGQPSQPAEQADHHGLRRMRLTHCW